MSTHTKLLQLEGSESEQTSVPLSLMKSSSAPSLGLFVTEIDHEYTTNNPDNPDNPENPVNPLVTPAVDKGLSSEGSENVMGKSVSAAALLAPKTSLSHSPNSPSNPSESLVVDPQVVRDRSLTTPDKGEGSEETNGGSESNAVSSVPNSNPDNPDNPDNLDSPDKLKAADDSKQILTDPAPFTTKDETVAGSENQNNLDSPDNPRQVNALRVNVNLSPDKDHPNDPDKDHPNNPDIPNNSGIGDSSDAQGSGGIGESLELAAGQYDSPVHRHGSPGHLNHFEKILNNPKNSHTSPSNSDPKEFKLNFSKLQNNSSTAQDHQDISGRNLASPRSFRSNNSGRPLSARLVIDLRSPRQEPSGEQGDGGSPDNPEYSRVHEVKHTHPVTELCIDVYVYIYALFSLSLSLSLYTYVSNMRICICMRCIRPGVIRGAPPSPSALSTI